MFLAFPLRITTGDCPYTHANIMTRTGLFLSLITPSLCCVKNVEVSFFFWCRTGVGNDTRRFGFFGYTYIPFGFFTNAYEQMIAGWRCCCAVPFYLSGVMMTIYMHDCPTVWESQWILAFEALVASFKQMVSRLLFNRMVVCGHFFEQNLLLMVDKSTFRALYKVLDAILYQICRKMGLLALPNRQPQSYEKSKICVVLRWK